MKAGPCIETATKLAYRYDLHKTYISRTKKANVNLLHLIANACWHTRFKPIGARTEFSTGKSG